MNAGTSQIQSLETLDAYRERATRTLALSLLVVASVGSTHRLVEALIDAPPGAILYAPPVALSLFGASYLLLRRGARRPGGALLLLGLFAVSSFVALFETSYIAFLSAVIGPALLRLASMVTGIADRSRVWFAVLPPWIAALLVARHAFDPFVGVDDGFALALIIGMGTTLSLVLTVFVHALYNTLLRVIDQSEAAREQLVVANEALVSARDAALAASRAKTTFLQTMSHSQRVRGTAYTTGNSRYYVQRDMQ